MERCPVCEGLTRLSKDCPSCGASMEDRGSIENYWDPYGPYQEEMASDDSARDPHLCVHLLQCPNCDENITYTVGRDPI